MVMNWKPTVICLVLFFTNTGHAEVVFDAATVCPTLQFGIYYGCANMPEQRQINFAPNQVTATTSAFLKSTPVTNKVVYKFDCKTSNQFKVGLQFGSQSHAFFWNQVGEVSSTYKLVEQVQQQYSLIFQPPSTSAPIWPGCVVNIISNVSYPDVDVLRTIVEPLKSNYADLNEVLNNIDAASELPVKWSAIKDAPFNIDGLVDSLNNEIAINQDELDSLAAVDQTALSNSDKLRLEQLPGIIELSKSMVNDLTNLKRDIGDVAAIARQCEANLGNAFCLDQVSKVSTSIANKISVRKSELVDMNTFLSSESARLKASSLSTSNALLRLVTKFQ